MIPKSLREKYGLKKGTQVRVVDYGNAADHPVAYANAFAAALAVQTGAKLVTGDPEFRLVEDTVRVHWLPQDK